MCQLKGVAEEGVQSGHSPPPDPNEMTPLPNENSTYTIYQGSASAPHPLGGRGHRPLPLDPQTG